MQGKGKRHQKKNNQTRKKYVTEIEVSLNLTILPLFRYSAERTIKIKYIPNIKWEGNYLLEEVGDN